MRSDELLNIIGEVADRHVMDAHTAKRHTFPNWAKISSAVAACLVIALGISLIPRINHADAPSSDGISGSGHSEGMVFMSYAGPIFPLTVSDGSGLDAERAVTYDFADYSPHSSIAVSDCYEIKNTGTSDVTVTAIYPIVGDMQDSDLPSVKVNGAETELSLHVGAYSGTFVSAGENSTSLNLKSPNSWADYTALLDGGTYMAEAFSDTPELNDPVTMYILTELTDGGAGDPASMCMSFDYNAEKTKILTAGFNGGGIRDDTGEEYRDFFIRDGKRKPDEETKYFIALGDDISSYTLQGYADGACRPGDEISGASATVARMELTLGEAIEIIARNKYDAIVENEFDGDHNRYISGKISFEMFRDAVITHYYEHGLTGTDPKERYDFGMLDDIVDETVTHSRIFYLTFEITVPAGGSASVDIGRTHDASYDFHCSGEEDTGIDGWDMVTTLGSALTFTEETAAITGYDGIEIIRQNFGFDIAAGVTEVALDVSEPHYWLEVKAKS